MRKVYTLLMVLLGLLFLKPAEVRASHVMGSDITWTCLGGDTFLITVTAYRDCNGIDLSATPIYFKSQCGGSTVTAGSSLCCGVDITPVCRNSCDRCSNAACKFELGIQQYQITAKIVLTNYNCCEFLLSWEQCCRNGAITTGAAGEDFYIETKMNKCVKPCDNSPHFNNPPVAIFCVNQCVVFNPGVSDIDRNAAGQGDSMVYSFGHPLRASGDEIPYSSGYSYDQPLQFFGFPNKDLDFDPPYCKGFHLDPATGDISFKATKTDITVMAIQVDEWRKDTNGIPQKIGMIRRDLQIAIIECPDNRSPFASGFDGTPSTSASICAGQSKCFTINTFDPDQDDTVQLSWNNQIPGATFTSEKGKKWPKGTFCWKPGIGDVRSYPYRFVVTAIDNACPVPGRTAKTFSITVIAPPEAGHKVVMGMCGQVDFSAFRLGKMGISSYSWSGSGNPKDWDGKGSPDPNWRFSGASGSHKYRKPGTYEYQVTITGNVGTPPCKVTYFDSLTIDPYVWVDLPRDTMVCPNSFVTIPTWRGLGKGPYLYEWSINPGLANRVKDKTSITATITKDTMFWVKIYDQNGFGCMNQDTMYIKVKQPPQPNLGPDTRSCLGDTVWLNSQVTEKKTVFSWYKRSVTTGKWGSAMTSTRNNLFAVRDSGEYKVRVRDSIGCYKEDSIIVYFNPEIRVIERNYEACQGDSLTMDGGVGLAGTIWTWQDKRYLTYADKGVVAHTKLYKLKATGPVEQRLEFLVTAEQTINGVRCFRQGTITLVVHAKPIVTAGKLIPQCIDNPPYSLGGYGKPLGGKWASTDNANSVVNNVLYPKVLGYGKHTLSYTYTDNNKCSNTDFTTIVIDSLPKVFAGRDTFRCMADGPMALNGQPTGGSWSGPGIVGLSGTSQSFDPAVAKQGKARLIYSYTNKTSAKCDNQDTVYIDVYNMPKVDAGQDVKVCQKGDKVLLNGSIPSPGTPGGFWTVDKMAIALTKDANGFYSFDPKVSGPGTFKLTWSYGYVDPRWGRICPVTDSLFIEVVPTASLSLNTADKQTGYCVNNGPVTLVGTSTRPGKGVYYSDDGKGVVNNLFFPDQAGIGDHIIHFKSTDLSVPGGCTEDVSMKLTVFDTPTVSFKNRPDLCKGKDYSLEVNYDPTKVDIMWGSPDGDFTDPKVSPATFKPSIGASNVGYFDVTVTATSKTPGSKCAPKVITQRYYINPQPSASFTKPKDGCAPLTGVFTNTTDIKKFKGKLTFVWDFGDGTPTVSTDDRTLKVTHTFDKVTGGTYQVSLTATSEKGCVDKVTEDVISFPSPVANFMADPSYTTISLPKIKFTSDGYTRGADGNAQYAWTFGDRNKPGVDTSFEKNPEWTYVDTGHYQVTLTVTNSNGCSGSVTKEVIILPELTVFIPNAFTPGKTGPSKNNHFYPLIAKEVVTNYEMIIYDRWGQQLYQATDVNDKGWDGFYKGVMCPEGVYVYVIKVTDLKGRDYKFTGSITLLR